MYIDEYPEKKMWHCRNRLEFGRFDFVPQLFLYKGKSDIYRAVVIWGDLEWVMNFKGRGRGHESVAVTLLGQFGRGVMNPRWNEVGKMRLPA